MISNKILVVEDEIIVAKDIKNRLEKFGYTVTAIAISGELAIKRIGENTPDLVLMDIRLKGQMDGVETAEKIRDNFNIPIIYLTANADESTLERAKVTDPFGYILKPFKEKELKTTIEITLNKYQTEKKLKQSEQWLATVLKSIGDGVITSDALGRVTFMNPVAEQLTGWKQQDAFGKEAADIFNIVHADADSFTAHPIKEVLQNGITVSIPEKTVLLAKNGVEIPIDDSVAAIKDDKGNITGAVLVFRDITERQQAKAVQKKQIEQERLLEQLEKLHELKDDFLSTVSHELRTPMANMKLAIQMLKVATTVEKSQLYLEILQNECNREIQLINELLDLQRLETSSYPHLLNEAVNLKDWLPSIIEPFRVRAEENNQTLHVNLATELPPLVTDRGSLERIIAELLNNACKYTDIRGKIIFSVCRNYSLFPSFSPKSISATIFTITNQAEIPAVELLRIFEKFYRVTSADRWKQGGTGLGLALVQKLVEHLQGTIQVESSNIWTTFTIVLPDVKTTNNG
jgi:PAS domain S-box-containing protein